MEEFLQRKKRNPDPACFPHVIATRIVASNKMAGKQFISCTKLQWGHVKPVTNKLKCGQVKQYSNEKIECKRTEPVLSCGVLCGDRHDFGLILPKTAALREKENLSGKLKFVEEDLSAFENGSSISDVINEKTIDLQNKTVKKYLGACEKNSPIFDVNNEKTIVFQEKSVEEDLSASGSSSSVYDVNNEKTSDSLKKNSRRKFKCF